MTRFPSARQGRYGFIQTVGISVVISLVMWGIAFAVFLLAE